jgi:hypothetical protein
LSFVYLQGHLLSRGTTVYFGDDLVTDGDEAVADDLDKTVISHNEMLRSRSSSVEESPPPLSPNEEAQEETMHKTKSDGNNNLSHTVKAASSHTEAVEGREKALELNIAPEDNSGHEYRYSILHISPANSGSNLAADDKSVDSSASGVTIGFSTSGLAAVTSFSQRPVVKSSSLPISEKIHFGSECDVKPTISQWSLDSGLSSVVGPPVTYNFTKDMFEEKKSFKMLSSGNLTKSESNVTTSNVRKASVPWKAKYSEEGVATQTQEDVICPGCGQVFPPRLHLKFLDHFEVCQKNIKDASKRSYKVTN